MGGREEAKKSHFYLFLSLKYRRKREAKELLAKATTYLKFYKKSWWSEDTGYVLPQSGVEHTTHSNY